MIMKPCLEKWQPTILLGVLLYCLPDQYNLLIMFWVITHLLLVMQESWVILNMMLTMIATMMPFITALTGTEMSEYYHMTLSSKQSFYICEYVLRSNV